MRSWAQDSCLRFVRTMQKVIKKAATPHLGRSMFSALQIQVALQPHSHLPCLCAPVLACQCYGSFERQPPSQVRLLAACGDRAGACTWAAQPCEEPQGQERCRPSRGRHHQKGHLHHHGPDWGPVRQPGHSGGDPLPAGEGRHPQRPPGAHALSRHPGPAMPPSCHTMCYQCKGLRSLPCLARQAAEQIVC